MKILNYLSCVLLALAVCACSSDDPLGPEQYSDDCVPAESSYSEDEARILSDNLLEKEGMTRSGEATCTVISSMRKSRNGGTNDTVAYVFNYPENGGFTIISKNAITNPILAFSYDDNFSFDNLAAKEMFVERVEQYVSKQTSRSEAEKIGPNTLIMAVKDHIAKINLGATRPFNKYIVTPDSEYIAGCVTVASTYCMLYGRDTLTCHGDYANHVKIIDALTPSPQKSPLYPPGGSGGGSTELAIPYTYDTAVDKVAKIMYWFGKDAKIKYGTKASSGYSTNARKVLSSYGYDVSPFYTYSIERAVETIMSNHIIYMDGRGKKDGHAWVVDGYTYAFTLNRPSVPVTYYLHCNWGWWGGCNGYFTGDVFTYEDDNYYKPSSFFSMPVLSRWAVESEGVQN